MSKYAGTQTEKNLMTAFAGESEARNKYTYFASVAKKQGFEQISALFLKTADNEKEHEHSCDDRCELLHKDTSFIFASSFIITGGGAMSNKEILRNTKTRKTEVFRVM